MLIVIDYKLSNKEILNIKYINQKIKVGSH